MATKNKKPIGKNPISAEPESDRSFMLRFLREAGTKPMTSEDVKRFTLLAFVDTNVNRSKQTYVIKENPAGAPVRHKAVDRTADIHIPMEDPKVLIDAFAKFLDSRSDDDRRAVESWMWRYGIRDKE